MVASFIINGLKLNRFEPDRIVTSNLVRPKTLAILRGLVCLYTLIVIVSVWITAESASDYLKFFTNLTYFGLVVYLVCSTIWSINYLRRGAADGAAWLRSGSPWWGYLHWLLYSTVVTFHFIVPIVYWTLLNAGAPLTSFGHWKNYSVHAIDGVFALFELVFNRHFLEPVHSLVVAAMMMLYMFLAFVVHKTKGEWVYPFLDWDQGAICAVYYLGIAVGLFLIFFLLVALHRLRNRWLAKRCARVNAGLGLLAEQQHQGIACADVSIGAYYNHQQSDSTLEEGGVQYSKEGTQTY